MTVARRVVPRVGRDLMALGDLSFHGIDPIARNSIANGEERGFRSIVAQHVEQLVGVVPWAVVESERYDFFALRVGVTALHDGVDGVARYLDDLLFSGNLAGFNCARTVLPLLGDDMQWPMPNVLNAVGDGLVFGYVGWLFDVDSVCEIDARVAIERCVGCGGGVELVPIERCRICCAAAFLQQFAVNIEHVACRCG